MALTIEQKSNVEDVLKASLRNKFQDYSPEPASMPFHTRLLGKDRLALYAFVHSLNTNFGTTIFEPVSLAFARQNFRKAEPQVSAGNHMSREAQRVIQEILDGLTIATGTPNKVEEVEKIRAVCQTGEMVAVKPTRIDLYLESSSDELFLFDLKTAKPNAGEFKGFKRTLLEWVAVTLADNPTARVNTMIAIPYNPYEPAPYKRWTMRGMLDLAHELKVANEFWDFLGGENTYEDLLGCFERVGIELRDEIDSYFRRFRTQ